MYSITKDYSFSAAHSLKGLKPGHKCARLHGHNYVVRVELEIAVLNNVGMVVDYSDLDELFDWVHDTWDHRVIELPTGLNSTAENIAAVLYWRARDLYGDLVARVGVSETPRTWAYYEEPPAPIARGKE